MFPAEGLEKAMELATEEIGGRVVLPACLGSGGADEAIEARVALMMILGSNRPVVKWGGGELRGSMTREEPIPFVPSWCSLSGDYREIAVASPLYSNSTELSGTCVELEAHIWSLAGDLQLTKRLDKAVERYSSLTSALPGMEVAWYQRLPLTVMRFAFFLVLQKGEDSMTEIKTREALLLERSDGFVLKAQSTYAVAAVLKVTVSLFGLAKQLEKVAEITNAFDSHPGGRASAWWAFVQACLAVVFPQARVSAGMKAVAPTDLRRPAVQHRWLECLSAEVAAIEPAA